MTYVSSVSCCGMLELAEIRDCSTAQQMAQTLVNDGWEGQPIILFSDIAPYENSAKLVKYIKENKLGSVKNTRAKVNPNTGNHVRAYLWAMNVPAFCKLFKLSFRDCEPIDPENEELWI